MGMAATIMFPSSILFTTERTWFFIIAVASFMPRTGIGFRNGTGEATQGLFEGFLLTGNYFDHLAASCCG